MENTHRAMTAHRDAGTTRIDCGDCRQRGPACSDCVVGVLLSIETPADTRRAHAGEGSTPPAMLTGPLAVSQGSTFVDDMPWIDGDDWVGQLWLTDDEQRAVEALAASGLTPPLRLVPRAS